MRGYTSQKPAERAPVAKKKTKKPDIPPAIRERVLERDKNRCRYCNTRSRLHLHHIKYRSQGGEHTVDNLITLCRDHHDLIHSDKPRFKPLCEGVLWFGHYTGRKLLIPAYEKWLKRYTIDSKDLPLPIWIAEAAC